MTGATIVPIATTVPTANPVTPTHDWEIRMAPVGRFVWNEQTNEAEIVWTEEPCIVFLKKKEA